MMLRGRNVLSRVQEVTNFSRPQWFVVSYSYSGIPDKKTKLAPLQERRMIDRFRLWAKGGDGGNGCSSYRRSRRDRIGRPDGGNGGRGGDVILECSTSVWDFSGLHHHINAKRGGHGAPKNMIGSRGVDKVVLVPIGTVIHLIEGEIPSPVEKKVEKKSTGSLDPWDIPGSLDLDSSESSQHSPTDESQNLEKMVIAGKGSGSRTKETLKKTARLSQFEAFHQSSSSKDKNRNQPGDYCESDDLDGDMYMSGVESEENMDETEDIQYDVAELTEPGQQIILASGGKGGMGNICASKRSKPHEDTDSNVEISDDEDQAPRNIGIPGSEVLLILELKSIADVGLVGMPNAGKSTLLGAISRAKPAVGHYAFTTLRPNLGNLNYNDLSITVADIPGLIKGAHQNRGLGHAFLRHIERTKVLAYVVDLAAAIDGRKGIPPWEQLKDLMLELECYREGLSERPSLIVANKIDEAGAEEVYEDLKERVPGVPIFPVCAVLEEGIAELKDGLKELVSGQKSSSLKLEDILFD